MQNHWNTSEAAACTTDLALCVYGSRLLGQDPSLVLHGGGNTSVKVHEQNLVGELEQILYVKGSGGDLATIGALGFAPVRMAHLVKLARLDALSDPEMMNELSTQVTRAGSPKPSVEAILHAILPQKFVNHTHADAVLAVTNTDGGEARIREIYGTDVVIVPYVMPGFDLARLAAKEVREQSHAGTVGMLLMNHGIFSFADDAKDAYDRMIDLVGRAEAYLARNRAWSMPEDEAAASERPLALELATLRRAIASAAGFPVILASHTEPRFRGFAARADVRELTQQGPLTPDHVLRTKRIPMVGRDVDRFVTAYRAYFAANAPLAKEPKTMLDPAPRVVLDEALGLCSVGRSAKDAAMVYDLYSRTIDVLRRSAALGGYRALSERDIFDVEYWSLEQAKLAGAGKPAVFSGEVALVTGAASGIGKACVTSLLARGAAVVGLDRAPDVATVERGPAYLGLRCDVTSEDNVRAALEAGVRAFGGIDMLILNAGIFPGAKPVASLSREEWRRVMDVNLDANLTLLRECHPLLGLAPNRGRVVIVGSKNVPAPGPGAAAYSASKAALTQLARVTALEWGGEGIRVNLLHPNAVFDTGIWTDDVLASRAESYGMSVAEYKTHNVLRTEVRSRDVAELAAELLGPLFAKSTGLQLAVNGGNERVI